MESSDFRYPSFDERKKANIDYPKLMRFGFKDKNELESIIEHKMEFEDVNRDSYLFQWDICLQNKIGKLHESYVNLATNYNRTIPDFSDRTTKDDYINSLLFDYYTETYYYFYFSVRDIIGQILNILCVLGLEENNVRFNELPSKIFDIEIKNIVSSFCTSTKKTSDYRNTFTHRFPANYPDYRSKISDIEGYKAFSGGTGKYTKACEFLGNIKESLVILSKFIEDLQIEFEKNKVIL